MNQTTTIGSMIANKTLTQADSEHLYIAILDLEKALGITREEASSRIKAGALYAGSPREVAAEYFASQVGQDTSRIAHLLPFINLKAFTRECLDSGRLVGTVIGGKSFTIEPRTA